MPLSEDLAYFFLMIYYFDTLRNKDNRKHDMDAVIHMYPASHPAIHADTHTQPHTHACTCTHTHTHTEAGARCLL